MSDETIRTILVGVDGSAGAAAALRWAAAIARATGAEVVAVHVYEGPGTTPLAPYPMVPDLKAWATAERHAFEQVWCAPLREAGVASRAVFRVGHAGPALVQAATEFGADLAVTGRRGLNTIAELVAGSVSQHLVHRAGCPVVVVPAAVAAATPVAAAAGRA
jgi:nucleotide-binding universal stress UspA family protein